MDSRRTEHATGHVVVEGDRISAVAARHGWSALVDVVLWRLDTLAHADIHDLVAALVLGAPLPLSLLIVQGRPVIGHGRVVAVDGTEVADTAAAANHNLLNRAGVT